MCMVKHFISRLPQCINRSQYITPQKPRALASNQQVNKVSLTRSEDIQEKKALPDLQKTPEPAELSATDERSSNTVPAKRSSRRVGGLNMCTFICSSEYCFKLSFNNGRFHYG